MRVRRHLAQVITPIGEYVKLDGVKCVNRQYGWFIYNVPSLKGPKGEATLCAVLTDERAQNIERLSFDGSLCPENLHKPDSDFTAM